MSPNTLPPGQIRTSLFPIVGENDSGRDLTTGNWALSFQGAGPTREPIDFERLRHYPLEEFQTDVHCVTGWSREATRFRGVRLRDVLLPATIPDSARFVRFIAYSSRNHDTSLPLEIALRNCWLVTHRDGEPLTGEQGGPVRIVSEGLYFYKSLKWLHTIELREHDQLGFWERESAYHNQADPWQEQRYDVARFTTPEQVLEIRSMASFASLRDSGQVVLGANFANWHPQSLDLTSLQLKRCNFDGANLQDANLRGTNLTLCKFFRADLRGADLTNADCEGADFSGARLDNVRMSNTALSAARFFTKTASGKIRGLKSARGLKIVDPTGLLEDQHRHLIAEGVEVVYT